MIGATAPGKLFLTGEWAVLRGAPAVVVAVDRLVRVEMDTVAGEGPLAIESLAEGRTWEGYAGGGAPLPGGDAGAVLAVLQEMGPVRGHVRVDSRPFVIGERKLGLGRSAATIAAAVTARHLLDGGAADPVALLAPALAANARFQEGQGSGADVAAAVHGGVVTARRDGGGLAVARRALPAGTHLVAGWTGESAATTPLVARFAALASPPCFADLVATAEAASAALEAGDAEGLRAAIARSAELLVRFGDETGLPIVTPALRTLVASAERAGAVAKPSGAGGGDCGIALAPTPAAAAAVRAAWREAGILPFDVVIAAKGACRG